MNDTRMPSTDQRPQRMDGGNSRSPGAFYLITFIFSIPAVFLYGPVNNDPGYIMGAGNDTGLPKRLLDLIIALACIGSALALYPVIKRQSERLDRLPGHADLRGGRHRHRRRQPDVRRRVAASRRSRRDRCVRPGRRGSGARRGPRPDLPARARRHARPERAAAGLRPVPLAPRAPGHPGRGSSAPRCSWSSRAHPSSASTNRRPSCPASRSSRSSSGSCRSASGSPSRGSDPRPLPPLLPTRATRMHRRRPPLTIATTGRCRMTAQRQRTATLLPRVVVRMAWVLHRALYRFSGGRIGLPPEAGGQVGMLRLRTPVADQASPGSRSSVTSRMARTASTLAMTLAEAEPAWWLNLQAHPDNVVELKEGSRAVDGRAAEGDEPRGRPGHGGAS